MRLLAGDIGGTKVLLAIVELDATGTRVIAEWRAESADYEALLPLVNDFFRSAGPAATSGIVAASFGIAGPVVLVRDGQAAKVTNLPWIIDSAELARALGVPVRLVNDFQALGYGLDALAADDFVTLQTGASEARAPCAIIGAGTGLGQGMLVWQGQHYEAIATEGGHVDFAPTDAIQRELLCHLATRFGHVSYERLLSGPGLINIYAFLHERMTPHTPSTLLAADDPAAAIGDAGLAGTDAVAGETLKLFARVYGAQAGNVALSCLATGGVFIGGGIAPKVLPVLCAPEFLRAFSSKGRMAPILGNIPVKIITNPKAGLVGAAVAARRLATTLNM